MKRNNHRSEMALGLLHVQCMCVYNAEDMLPVIIIFLKVSHLFKIVCIFMQEILHEYKKGANIRTLPNFCVTKVPS